MRVAWVAFSDAVRVGFTEDGLRVEDEDEEEVEVPEVRSSFWAALPQVVVLVPAVEAAGLKVV